ncbi:hypothetical protein AMATHDRAFT_149784, partial [Amanita thiersii Skay4041]
IATPPQFNGKMENIKVFIDACDIYIKSRLEEFTTVECKCNFILSYCSEGMAATWRTNYLVWSHSQEVCN